MKPGITLKMAFAIVSIYAFVTILFLDGKNRDDAGSLPRLAEKAPRLPAPGTLLPRN
jgi:hypothetical protein